MDLGVVGGGWGGVVDTWVREVSWGRVFEEEWFGGWWMEGWKRNWGNGFGNLEGGEEGRELEDVLKKRPLQILRRSVCVKSRPDVR